LREPVDLNLDSSLFLFRWSDFTVLVIMVYVPCCPRWSWRECTLWLTTSTNSQKASKNGRPSCWLCLQGTLENMT
jgi:hypothetical protein